TLKACVNGSSTTPANTSAWNTARATSNNERERALESLNHSHVNNADRRWAHQPISILRHQGYRGKAILRHRAFQKLPLKPWALVSAAATAFVLTLTWLFLRAPVGQLWAGIFQVWLQWLGLPGAVTMEQSHGTYFETVLPRV